VILLSYKVAKQRYKHGYKVHIIYTLASKTNTSSVVAWHYNIET